MTGAARGDRHHHGVSGETDTHSHQGAYERFDTLAHISWSGLSGASLGKALEGNQHLQGLHFNYHQNVTS